MVFILAALGTHALGGNVLKKYSWIYLLHFVILGVVLKCRQAGSKGCEKKWIASELAKTSAHRESATVPTSLLEYKFLTLLYLGTGIVPEVCVGYL